MTDKKPSKPVTLADYIPPEPAPQRTPKPRRTLSKHNRERLDDLDKSIREDGDKPKSKKKSKPSLWTTIFWIAVLIVIANWVS